MTTTHTNRPSFQFRAPWLRRRTYHLQDEASKVPEIACTILLASCLLTAFAQCMAQFAF